MPGPVPKPPDQLRRRNADAQYRTAAVGGGAEPPYGRDGRRQRWTEIQRRWWRALYDSGQVHEFEPTDWEVAVRACEVLVPKAYDPSSRGWEVALRELRLLEERLLFTVAARRRARLELPKRAAAESGAPSSGREPTPIDAIRSRAMGGA